MEPDLRHEPGDPAVRWRRGARLPVRRQHGGHALGLINPAIYQIVARHEPGVVDITKGNNTPDFRTGGKRYTVKGFTAQGAATTW